MAGDERQGWAILAAMGVLFLAGVAVAYWAEAHANPALTALGVDGMGGNMEGKEVRFGIAASALFAVITTAASCGAVNAMHASFMPLGGMIPLINMELGEIIIGGVGAGLYGMLLFVIIAMFVAGLMVGRTPEYVGKKLEAKEVKMTMLAILVLPLAMLGFTALAVVIEPGLAGLLNKGPHGFSEVLYAYTSGAANNGSAFAGLTANSLFYNTTLGIGDAARTLRDDRPDAGGRRLARRQEADRALARHPANQPAPVRGPAGGRHPDRRRPDLLPRPRPGPDRRAAGDAGRHPVLSRETIMMTQTTPLQIHRERKRMPVAAMLDPAILLPAIPEAFRKLDPRLMIKNPVMFVVEVVTVLTTVLLVRDLAAGAGGTGFSFQIVAMAVGHAPVREPGRGGGRGPRQGAGRLAAAHPHRGQGQARGLGGGPQLARGLGTRPSSRATSSWSRPAT